MKGAAKTSAAKHVLHQSYTRQQIVEALGPPKKELYGGQFLVTAKTVACLFDTAEGPNETHLFAANELRWIPRKVEKAGAAPWPWIPTEVRPKSPLAKGGVPLYLRRRRGADDPYTFVGPALQNRLEGSPQGGMAAFSLRTPIPEDLFVALGGYHLHGRLFLDPKPTPGQEQFGRVTWLERDHRPLDDATSLRRAIERLLAAPEAVLQLTRYDGSRMTVFWNEGHGTHEYVDPKQRMFWGKVDQPPPGGWRQLHITTGQQMKYPPATLADGPTVEAVLREFADTGRPAERLKWVEPRELRAY